MSTLFGNATSALLSFQRAIATTSHNVANANTEGYSRQRVDLAARPGQPFGYGFVGAGLQVTGIRRVVDEYQFLRGLDSSAELGRLSELANLATRIDKGFTDPGTSLTQPWSNFFDAMQGVATQPASAATRQELLQSAETLVARFRTLDGQLKAMDTELNNKLGSSVGLANQLSSEIARLNVEIVRQTGLAGGQPPNDLLDQRERLAAELSGLVGANVAMQNDGAMNVFTSGGQALVVGGTATRLATVADPYRPERQEVALLSSGGAVRLGPGALGGQIGGLLEFRNTVLDPVANQLGRIAMTLVDSFNAQHREGMDLYGDMGGDFFTPIGALTRPNALNTGTGSLSATLVDPSAFDGADLVLSFDGASWSAVRRSTGAAVPISGTGTAGDPLLVGGTAVVVGGAPAAGDRFLLQPASGAGGRMGLAITDPSRIAAASPLGASVALANVGNAQPIGLQIDDIAAPGFPASAQIVFTSPTTYSIDGGPPQAYDPTVGIVGAGWTLRLEGEPVTGDTFGITPRGPGSSDNGNALLFAAIDDLGVLEGGNLSLNSALAQMTVGIGSAARQADYALDAQRIVDQQLAQEREATSGVNLDEEAANLLRFQQAYQAAAQMISVADTLFQTLLGAVRR